MDSSFLQTAVVATAPDAIPCEIVWRWPVRPVCAFRTNSLVRRKSLPHCELGDSLRRRAKANSRSLQHTSNSDKFAGSSWAHDAVHAATSGSGRNDDISRLAFTPQRPLAPQTKRRMSPPNACSKRLGAKCYIFSHLSLSVGTVGLYLVSDRGRAIATGWVACTFHFVRSLRRVPLRPTRHGLASLEACIGRQIALCFPLVQCVAGVYPTIYEN